MILRASLTILAASLLPYSARAENWNTQDEKSILRLAATLGPGWAEITSIKPEQWRPQVRLYRLARSRALFIERNDVGMISRISFVDGRPGADRTCQHSFQPRSGMAKLMTAVTGEITGTIKGQGAITPEGLLATPLNSPVLPALSYDGVLAVVQVRKSLTCAVEFYLKFGKTTA